MHKTLSFIVHKYTDINNFFILYIYKRKEKKGEK